MSSTLGPSSLAIKSVIMYNCCPKSEKPERVFRISDNSCKYRCMVSTDSSFHPLYISQMIKSIHFLRDCNKKVISVMSSLISIFTIITLSIEFRTSSFLLLWNISNTKYISEQMHLVSMNAYTRDAVNSIYRNDCSF